MVMRRRALPSPNFPAKKEGSGIGREQEGSKGREAGYCTRVRPSARQKTRFPSRVEGHSNWKIYILVLAAAAAGAIIATAPHRGVDEPFPSPLPFREIIFHPTLLQISGGAKTHFNWGSWRRLRGCEAVSWPRGPRLVRTSGIVA